MMSMRSICCHNIMIISELPCIKLSILGVLPYISTYSNHAITVEMNQFLCMFSYLIAYSWNGGNHFLSIIYVSFHLLVCNLLGIFLFGIGWLRRWRQNVKTPSLFFNWGLFRVMKHYRMFT